MHSMDHKRSGMIMHPYCTIAQSCFTVIFFTVIFSDFEFLDLGLIIVIFDETI